jgi:hypothetical protein
MHDIPKDHNFDGVSVTVGEVLIQGNNILFTQKRCIHIFLIIFWVGVRLSPLGTSATIWPIVPDPNGR